MGLNEMDEKIKNELMKKNKKLIDMVIERAKREFADDIAIIGLTGSFATGDFHEKSDLDLIIVNDTPRGWDMAFCFILGDVGYDIYCTPWETRIDAKTVSELRAAAVGLLKAVMKLHDEMYNEFAEKVEPKFDNI